MILTGHQLGEMAESLAEDNVPMLRHSLLKFFLQVSAAVLILAQVRNLAL